MKFRDNWIYFIFVWHEETILPYSSHEAGTLYSSGTARSLESGLESRVDLAVDENGLWAIYTLPYRNNTAVVKVNS